MAVWLKAKKLAAALPVIEEECGIHEVEVSIQGQMNNPWINLAELQNTGMEKLLAELFFNLKRNVGGS